MAGPGTTRSPRTDRLGKPRYPRPEQVQQINRESALAPPETMRLQQGHVAVPVNGLAFLEIAQ